MLLLQMVMAVRDVDSLTIFKGLLFHAHSQCQCGSSTIIINNYYLVKSKAKRLHPYFPAIYLQIKIKGTKAKRNLINCTKQ